MTDQNMAYHSTDQNAVAGRIMKSLAPWMLVVCLLPFFLMLAGINFSSSSQPFDIETLVELGLSGKELTDQMFHALAGSLHHSLLEWTSVVLAVFSVILSFVHYRSSLDITVPIIGLALLFSGLMDAFHTMAALRLIDGVADTVNLVPFTWALSRGFHAIILVIGTGVALFFIHRQKYGQRLSLNKAEPWLLLVAVIGVVIGYGLIRLIANVEALPQTQYPGAFITRPFDAFPLLVFGCAAPLFWALHKKSQTIFTAALVLQIIPEVTLEAHMAFGSSALYDSHFNVAHFLKIIAYAVPFLGLLVDYTNTYQAKEKAEETAHEAQEKADLALGPLDAILRSAGDAIIISDKNGVIRTFNPAAERMFGYSEAEAQGQNVKALVGDEHRDHHDHYLERYQKTGVKSIIGQPREVMARRRNGEEFPIELSVSEAATPHGILYTGMLRDISRRKLSEQELQDKMDQLAETNAELDKFAYIASHDLKAPLRSIESLAEWIEEDQGDPEAVKEHIELMNGRIKRMERLLDDLLQYSRIGRKNMQLAEIDTGEVIRNQIQLTSTPPEFTFHVADEMPVLKTLAVPFELVMRNLVSNAIKHHDRKDGRIEIRCNEDEEYLEFVIEDDGPGIASEFHSKIFEVFQTLKSRDDMEGSGIGLALVRKTTQVYGGDVWVDSEPGKGARFHVRWPKETAAA